MNANIILNYLIEIATYMYDAFAMIFDLGMQPLSETLIGNFTIIYTNPFNNIITDFSFNIGDILLYFDIPGFVFHNIFRSILENMLNFLTNLPLGEYILSMPTAFGVLMFSSVIFFITCLIRLIVRMFA